jgi:hypothetical protein
MTTNPRRPASPYHLVFAAALALAASPAAGLDLRADAAGLEVDLLPTISSAAVGASRNRLRMVGAHLHYPDAFVSKPFADRSATVAALLYDRFFRDDYSGPWVAVGAELWWSCIGLRSGEGRGSWSTPVATVGAGWVFPIWRGVYLNPWAAAHAPLAASGVAVGAERYQPRALEAEASLKVGWGARVSP